MARNEGVESGVWLRICVVEYLAEGCGLCAFIFFISCLWAILFFLKV